MYFLLRTTPFFSSIIALIGVMLLRFYPQWLISIVGELSVTGIVVTSLFFFVLYFVALIFIGAGHPFTSRIRFYPFLFLLWFSGLFVFFFTENAFILWFLTIALPLCSWVWIENLFLFWQRSTAYQAYSLQKLANYLYLIVFFLFTSAAIGVQVLLQIPFWVIAFISAIVYFILQFDFFLLYTVKRDAAFVFSALGTVLSMQALIILNLLPTHFFLYGLNIMLFFYIWNKLVLQLVKQKKQGEVKIGLELITASCSALIVFFTTYLLR